GRQLGREVQRSPNHLHFPRAQSRRRSDVPGQWRGQSRHGASGSRGQEHASTALAKGAAIRRKIVVDARRSRRRKTNSLIHLSYGNAEVFTSCYPPPPPPWSPGIIELAGIFGL